MNTAAPPAAAPHAARLPRRPAAAMTSPQADGGLWAERHGDTYFSRAGGLAETRAVFLDGCGLPAGWAGRRRFVVLETGFGSGLNLLELWRAWRAARPDGASVLHAVSCEAWPLPVEAAAHVHAAFPEIDDLSAALRARWPVAAWGVQRLWFEADGFCLTLATGPAEAALDGLDLAADCVFLDGFAPRVNPDMWAQGVLDRIGRLTRPGGRAATWSVAGAVRRGLEVAGFSVSRVPGFAGKRQRLEAVRTAGDDIATGAGAVGRTDRDLPASVLVIGGGVAGACAAWSLARRGIDVELFDDDPCGRHKASFNPAALVMPRLDRDDGAAARFFRDAFLHARDLWSHLPPGDDGAPVWQETGVEERPRSGPSAERSAARLADLVSDPPLPDGWLVASPHGGATHMRAGLVSPHAALKALTARARRHDTRVCALRRDPADGAWVAIDANGGTLARAAACIVAAGPALARLADPGIALSGRAGQISLARLTRDDALPARPLAGGAWAAGFAGRLLYGAAFEDWPLDPPAQPEATPAGHARNRALLAELNPDLAGALDPESEPFGRASVRVATPDRLPLAGPSACGTPGLWVLGGFGARGFTTAPLAAEIVVSRLSGDPWPVDRNVAAALDPARFAKRAARKAGLAPPGGDI